MVYRVSTLALLCATALIVTPAMGAGGGGSSSLPSKNGELAARIKAGADKAQQACASCHGAEGNSVTPQFPNLAGQVPGYVSDQLKLFKSGERENAIMKGIAEPLTEEEMLNLDLYYASLKAAPGSVPESDAELAQRGERLYRGGYGPMGVSACMSCHGPSGHGVPRRFPRVAGQKKEYLEQQLLAFKSGKRKSYSDMMNNIAFRLSEQQIKDLAAFMHALQ